MSDVQKKPRNKERPRAHTQLRRVLEVLRTVYEIGPASADEVQWHLQQNAGVAVNKRSVYRDLVLLEDVCLIEHAGRHKSYQGGTVKLYRAAARIQDVE